jgi:hypothetical protein
MPRLSLHAYLAITHCSKRKQSDAEIEESSVPSPLTARDRELLAMPSVVSQFPVAFANAAVWEEFDGECSCSGKTLQREHVRGLVAKPIERVATVEAVGVCWDCKLVTRFDYRLHDDMRLTGRREDGWKTWQATPTLVSLFVSFIKRLAA